MDFTGRYQIPAPPEDVWAGLTDPEMLAAAIPGCEALARTGDNDFSGTVAVRIGPVQASFKGKATLSQMEPLRRLVLTGSGDGGVAGFAGGSAEILLAAKDGGTELTYKADADVGGKLAQTDQRLIDGAARQMADQFFERFAARLAPRPEPGLMEKAPAAVEPGPRLQSWMWILGLVGVVIILLALFVVVS